MRSETGTPWLMSDDEAYLLQLALYVRDACYCGYDDLLRNAQHIVGPSA